MHTYTIMYRLSIRQTYTCIVAVLEIFSGYVCVCVCMCVTFVLVGFAVVFVRKQFMGAGSSVTKSDFNLPSCFKGARKCHSLHVGESDQ